ncbi:MAG: 7-cyano-7-deazaguanine synthase [Okeania sp. SIO3H1]|nr:7-cyano-7-deazaguanine synthase [Okeania sp. SIO3H1]
MRAVVLASGGLDSTLLACLAHEQGYDVFPLFVDYGQIAAQTELKHCIDALKTNELREPVIADLKGFGKLVPSGLTNSSFDIVDQAFTPGRNSLFLLCAASYAATIGADTIMIGLLDERFHLFSDQTEDFLEKAETFLNPATGGQISIKAPLMAFSKQEIIAMAEAKKIGPTYSCHVGSEVPCGICIACKEFDIGEA